MLRLVSLQSSNEFGEALWRINSVVVKSQVQEASTSARQDGHATEAILVKGSLAFRASYLFPCRACFIKLVVLLLPEKAPITQKAVISYLDKVPLCACAPLPEVVGKDVRIASLETTT